MCYGSCFLVEGGQRAFLQLILEKLLPEASTIFNIQSQVIDLIKTEDIYYFRNSTEGICGEF